MPFKDKEKAREYARIWHQKHMSNRIYRLKQQKLARNRSRKLKKFLNEYKVKMGCVDCGYKKHAAALDFDHVKGKNMLVSSCKSISKAIEEIKLCVIRCANCHRIKTYKEYWSKLKCGNC